MLSRPRPINFSAIFGRLKFFGPFIVDFENDLLADSCWILAALLCERPILPSLIAGLGATLCGASSFSLLQKLIASSNENLFLNSGSIELPPKHIVRFSSLFC